MGFDGGELMGQLLTGQGDLDEIPVGATGGCERFLVLLVAFGGHFVYDEL